MPGQKGFVMSQSFTNFRESEDGRVNVEYAVIAALAVIGLLIAVFTSRSSNATSTRSDGFTVTLRNDARTGATSDQRRAGRKSLADAVTQDGPESRSADEDSANGTQVGLTGPAAKVEVRDRHPAVSPKPSANAGTDDATSPDITDAATKTDKATTTMSEEDARRAIVGLLKAYPMTFATSTATIASAPIVRNRDHIEIASFACYLKSHEFAYRPTLGRDARGMFGVFYRNDNGEWTGRITKTVP
jgi:Flp pilus assembly pilin Flp